MTLSLFLIFIAVSAFAGFAIGRIGDRYGGHINGPHHWIYGLLIAAFGAIFFAGLLMWVAVAFGIGLFISDLEDFFKGKFYGVDEPHDWRFWSLK
jgi:MFS family permease